MKSVRQVMLKSLMDGVEGIPVNYLKTLGQSCDHYGFATSRKLCSGG